MQGKDNPYIPEPAIILKIRRDSSDTKTFRVRFEDEAKQKSFTFKAGQFMEVSVLGVGEAPISICSSPSERAWIEMNIRAVGSLTGAMHRLREGDIFHMRGPYGNSFPFEEIKGKNLLFAAGGIGLAPLRPLLLLVLEKRKLFGRIQVLHGAKSPGELLFRPELESFARSGDIELLLTVDQPDESWRGNIGLITALWEKYEILCEDAVAFVCGPPVMIHFTIQKLLESGFPDERIFTTLERHMKCGIGKCGHCNIGEKFVCVDGPVFSLVGLKGLPKIG